MLKIVAFPYQSLTIVTILSGVILPTMPRITALLATATLVNLPAESQTPAQWHTLYTHYAKLSGLSREDKIKEVSKNIPTPPDFKAILTTYSTLDHHMPPIHPLDTILPYFQALIQEGANVYTTSIATQNQVSEQLQHIPGFARYGIIPLHTEPTISTMEKPHFDYIKAQNTGRTLVAIFDAKSEVEMARKANIPVIGFAIPVNLETLTALANLTLEKAGTKVRVTHQDLADLDLSIFQTQMSEAGPDTHFIYSGPQSLAELTEKIRQVRPPTL